MNNKNLDTVMRIIGTICVNMGAWLLYNSTYTTNIDGDDVAKTIFLYIRPNNQLLIIISLVTIVLGIIILFKKEYKFIQTKNNFIQMEVMTNPFG